MKKLLGIFITALAILFMFTPAIALADSLFQPAVNEACAGAQANDTGGCDSNAANNVNRTLGTAINIFSVIVGIITVIMFLIGAFRFITSGGDPNNINRARQSLIYAIVGLIIVLIAQVLIRYVFTQVSSSKNGPQCGTLDGNGHCTGCPDTNPADGACDTSRLKLSPTVADLYKLDLDHAKLLSNYIA